MEGISAHGGDLELESGPSSQDSIERFIFRDMGLLRMEGSSDVLYEGKWLV